MRRCPDPIFVEARHRGNLIDGALVRWLSFARLQGDLPAFAIAIPARNEAERVLPCLDACHVALGVAGVPGRILLLVNNSTDATALLAADWALRNAVTLDIVEVVLPAARAHAGAARRLALDLARRGLAPGGALMTTDADSRPARGWVAANLRELARGAALVCGRIELDAVEHARLPAALTRKGDVEDRYFRASLELASLLDPDPFNPWPHHGRTSGASLAIAAGAYDRIGGAPIVACGEDRALARRVIEHDLPIVHSDAALVVTSCRLDGRAPGGMADTMRMRMGVDDYPCDELLEPAELVLRRADARARTRRLWAEGAAPARLLAGLGLGAAERRQAASRHGFGAWWAFVEGRSPGLARKSLTSSEVAAELPRLMALLDTVRRRGRPALGPGVVRAEAARMAEGEPVC